MELSTVAVKLPKDVNVIIGQAHFIKAVDDLHEVLISISPVLRFGVAFCEASGPRLIRRSGNDGALVEFATATAQDIGAGHAFVIALRGGFPIAVLNQVQGVTEVCSVFCATANNLDVIVASTERGRGILGVIDGHAPLGVETDLDVSERREMLRKLGYKLG